MIALHNMLGMLFGRIVLLKINSEQFSTFVQCFHYVRKHTLQKYIPVRRTVTSNSQVLTLRAVLNYLVIQHLIYQIGKRA